MCQTLATVWQNVEAISAYIYQRWVCPRSRLMPGRNRVFSDIYVLQTVKYQRTVVVCIMFLRRQTGTVKNKAPHDATLEVKDSTH